MILLGRLFISVAVILGLVIDIYKIIVLAAVILSWVRPDPYNPLVKFIYKMTEPVFRWIRNRLPRSFASFGIDFSPFIVFLVLIFVESFVVGFLNDTGRTMVYNAQISPIRTHTTTIKPSSNDETSQDNKIFQYP